jgi:hypothetical protein
VYRYLTVSQDNRLVLATTDKETRQSNGFALFDALTFEPVLFDDEGDNWYKEFTLLNDYIAYRPKIGRERQDFKKLVILDLLHGENTTSIDYT